MNDPNERDLRDVLQQIELPTAEPATWLPILRAKAQRRRRRGAVAAAATAALVASGVVWVVESAGPTPPSRQPDQTAPAADDTLAPPAPPPEGGSWAQCDLPMPIRQDSGGRKNVPGWFNEDAPSTGALVTPGPTALAICKPRNTLGELDGGNDLVVVTEEVDELVDDLNSLPRGADRLFCDDAEGLMVRLVFWYPDNTTLPILLDGETCGWAANGNQERVDATDLSNVRIPDIYRTAARTA